jgi:hypothetical protein
MRKPAAALILIISLLITGLAVAEPSEDATKAFERGDHTTVKALAEKGDARAQAILALIYLLGQGSPEDISGAVKWSRKSAEQGDAFAQSILGHFYLEGKVFPQDNTEAVKWFRKAAEQEDDDSQDTLAEICYSEKKLPRSGEMVATGNRAR